MHNLILNVLGNVRFRRGSLLVQLDHRNISLIDLEVHERRLRLSIEQPGPTSGRSDSMCIFPPQTLEYCGQILMGGLILEALEKKPISI